jgi:hypothetical protein
MRRAGHGDASCPRSTTSPLRPAGGASIRDAAFRAGQDHHPAVSRTVTFSAREPATLIGRGTGAKVDKQIQDAPLRLRSTTIGPPIEAGDEQGIGDPAVLRSRNELAARAVARDHAQA